MPRRSACYPGSREVRSRLHLDAGEIVVLELGADDPVPTLRHKGDIVLNETAEEVKPPSRRLKRYGEAIPDGVCRKAITQSPNDLLPRGKREPMLKIEVDGVADFLHNGPVVFRMIVVEL